MLKLSMPQRGRGKAGMLRKLFVAAVILALIGAVAFWIITIPQTVAANALPPRKPDLDNGKVIFNAGGCVGCHTLPKQEDRTRLNGGLALNSPFGAFYVPNISPDPNDGIGAWSEADFITAMTKGTSPDGRHYFPAFPYTSYQHMKQDDLRDLFAYLKTLPPVAGKVRDHAVPFPFNIRRTLGAWKFLFLDGQPFRPDASKSDEWNRGAYLVTGPGHCVECHSPRNAVGAIIADKRFAGGPAPDGQGGVPNLTQFKLKNWTTEDFLETLTTGMTPDADAVGGAMTEVVRSTSQLPEADRKAMAVYLKSLSPVEGLPPRK